MEDNLASRAGLNLVKKINNNILQWKKTLTSKNFYIVIVSL